MEQLPSQIQKLDVSRAGTLTALVVIDRCFVKMCKLRQGIVECGSGGQSYAQPFGYRKSHAYSIPDDSSTSVLCALKPGQALS